MNANNSVIKILAEALEKGISVFLDGDSLKLKVAKNKKIDPEFIQFIKGRKDEITQFLYSQREVAHENQTTIDPITAFDREAYVKIPLSYAQERLWFIDKLEGSVQYNIPSVIQFNGDLDVDVLEYAFANIVNRHDVLRTVFGEEEGIPYQVILPKNEWKLNVVDCTNTDKATIDQTIEAETQKPFDLSQDFMLRANLFKTNSNEFILTMVVHHIASDGWSTPILVEELMELYLAKKENRAATLPELAIQYADYAVWQKEYLTGEVLNQKLSYWENQLKGTEPINLPTDFVRPAIQSLNGSSTGLLINKELSEQVVNLSKSTGATMSMLLVSVLKMLLSRYSGQKDICVGMPVANRNSSEIEPLLGFFVNTLALRSTLDDQLSFVDFIKQEKKTMLEAFSHQDVPFEKIVDRVEKGRDMSRSPLFQVIFTFHNTRNVSILKLGDVEMNAMPITEETTPFDMSWDLNETEEGLQVGLEYCTDLFKQETVERILKHFEQLLAAIVGNPTLPLDQFSMLLEEERAQILGQEATANGEWFNLPAKDLNNNKAINVLFEDIVAANENSIAVIHGEERWTYGQVNELANQIAHTLRNAGVETGHFVGVYTERNPALLATLLGVIKSGAVYVPLDTQNPTERIEKMIANSNMAAIISTNDWVAQLGEVATSQVFLLDEMEEEVGRKLDDVNTLVYDRSVINAAKTDNPSNLNEMDSWAYMLYTSGSTGEPKGAITRHDGAMNHILAEYELLALEDGFRFLQSAGIGSDISLWQMLAPVLKAGAVVIVDKFDILNYDAIIKLLETEEISIVEFVPSYIWGLVEQLKATANPPALNSLKWIMMVGEQVPVKLVNDFRNLYPNVRILNGYGPCEASDDISQYEVIGTLNPNQVRVPIGRSLINMNMFVLDARGELCPVGIAGELCVSGVGVGAGYYGMPEKTANSFVKNPFPNTLGDVLYKTGDLGRWLPNGTLEFLGRIDRQIKIRGHRVELGEIETYIREDANIKDAHIMVHRNQEEGAQDALVAFVVVNDEEGTENRILGKPFLNEIEAKIQQHIEANPHLADEVLELEKGIKAFALNQSESLFAYNEIFENQTYLKHGISLKPGDVVFDVGANTGMFSMFVSLHFPGTEIYAFEPLPPTFEIMDSNASIYGGEAKIKTFQAGLSNKKQVVSFTHYPNNSMLSSHYGNLEEDKNYVKSILEKQAKGESDSDMDIQRIMDETMNYEEYKCQMLKLSDVIKENNIEQIDLLKVDVKRSELDVLKGIKVKDWPKIKQLVIEVYEDGKSLGSVKALLDKRGYNYRVEQDDLSAGTYLYKVYAQRKDSNKETLAENTQPKLIGLDSITKELFAQCQDGLPAYMQPTEYCVVEKIPLNLSDKVDQKSLIVLLEEERQRASGKASSKEGKSCTTKTEQNILAVWEKVLDRKGIAVDEDFFEAGGHSLLAMRVKAALEKELDIDIDIRDLFLYKTIETLAKYIDTKDKTVTQSELTVKERGTRIPLSFAQERLWFIDKLEGSIHYQIPLALRLSGDVDSVLLESALKEIINRHEVLRTVYREEDGVGYQEVLPKDIWKLTEVEATHLTDKESLVEYIESEMVKPFDLSKDHMLRAQLLNIKERESVLVFVLHHIAFDGWSEAIIVEEFKEFYAAKLEGRAANVADLPIQYADYAIWQKEYLNETVLNEKLNYWENKLSGVEPMNLPLDFSRPSVQSTKGKSIEYNIAGNVKEELKKMNRNEGSTMYMTLLAAFKVLLHRYTGQNDICIASPSANRMQEEVESMIGFFLNTMVLRNDLSNNPTFRELLNRVKQTSLEAYSHQDVPFEKILDRVIKVRDMSRSALSEVVFVHQHIPDQSIEKLGDITLTNIEFETEQSYTDIHFSVTELADGINIGIKYCTDLFAEATMVRMMEHYESLLQAVIQNPAQTIGQLDLLKATEKTQLIETYNNTTVDFPASANLVNLFEEQVAKFPNEAAVVFDNKTLTYKELNDQANKLAQHIKTAYDIQPDDLVGVMMERSEWSVVAILGILKAGAAYVPIDIDYPMDRKSYIIEDTNLKALIIQSESLFDVLEFSINIFSIDIQMSELEDVDTNLNLAIAPNDLAYVIYTSGSTGKPKGVMIEHASIKNTVFSQIDGFDIEEGDHCLQFASFSFDASVSEAFTALCAGASLYIVSKQVRSNPIQFLKYMNENQVQVATIPPAYLDQLNIGELTCLKTLVTAGESAVYEKAEAFLQHGTYLNAYGPTEASICATMFKVQKGNALNKDRTNVPIGVPISNAQIYIIDGNEELVPVGVVGELCIAGNGLARGYLNRPELTTEKFIANTFNPEKSERIYKTGDLARWLPDGNIEFLGRVDSQVKIRGFRIELEEVEAVLQQAPNVSQCVVMAKGESIDSKRLVAYVVAEGEYDRATIQAFLKDQLPDYMVPSQMMEMPEMPMTINGKIDKKALPDPNVADLVANEFVAPSTETEIQIAKVWKGLLKIDKVGINDNFFDLGGHSLMAARIIAAVRKELNLEIAMIDVFTYPTIASLSAFLEAKEQQSPLSVIELQERPDRIPLSFAQERLWFIDKLEGSLHYHMPAALKFEGDLDVKALGNSIQEVINRHEVIRTVFEEADGKAYQKVLPTNQWKLDFTPMTEFEGEQQDFIDTEVNKPFDLSQDHMLRAHLLQTAEKEYILVFVMHHIASDGWSMSILVDELMSIYKAKMENLSPVLAELPIQYADFALWQRRELEGEVLESKLEYWNDKLSGTEPLNMPTDFTRPSIQSTNGRMINLMVNQEVSQKLEALAKEEGVTMFMLLLSAIKVLLSKYSSQSDICIGTPIASRSHQETESLIGYFLNTLALRSDLSDNPDFSSLLAQVKDTTMAAYANQEVPFEKIVDHVEKGRDQSRSPIFQVMFVLQNTPEMADLKLGDLKISDVSFEEETALFDLTFNIEETAAGLDLKIVYCSDLFSADTVERLAKHFETLLSIIAQDASQSIDEMSMLTASETTQLTSFVNPVVEYQRDKTIVDLFENQVEQTPDNIALVFQKEELTYRELNNKANQFAAYLAKRGVEKESLVVLTMDPGVELIIAMFGILKAGGAYVPIDPDYPQDRINYIIEDARAAFVVSTTEHVGVFEMTAGTDYILMDEAWSNIATESTENLALDLSPNNLMYVIYTSGSTGKPKGVLLEHGNLVRLFKNEAQLFDFNENDVWTMFHSFCFDFSVWEMYGALLFGGQLIVVSKEVRKDVVAYGALLFLKGVTVLNQTPGSFNILQESFLQAYDTSNLRYVIFGGEALNPTILQQWNASYPECKLINMYGITETTVHVTYKELSVEDLQASTSNIGRAIPTLDTYVLDASGNLSPIGIAGELYVAGAGLARGYLNRPELTAERFITNEEGVRLYKTGDLARWLPSGELEYLGRIDHQVKIRGFRIELGEIKSVLLQSSAVNKGVVIAREDANGNRRLVAYVVPEGEYNRTQIQNDLAAQLPDYMVPGLIMELDQLPLTVNGKINKKALPDPDASQLITNEYVVPSTDVEVKLAEIWKGLLNVNKVGIYDNFFELGGDSIITIQVISRAKKVGIQLRPRDLFQHQTIASLAKVVEKSQITLQAEQGVLSGEAKMLPIQKWFFENGKTLNHYNQAELLELSKSIDPEQLKEITSALVQQHDALRFNYQNEAGWTQRYGAVEGTLEEVDLSHVSKEEIAPSITKICQFFQENLEVEHGELIKVVFIKTPKTEANNRLFIVIHHLAIDNVSWRILIDHMEEGLKATANGDTIDLGAKSSSYREWVNALQVYAETKPVINQLSYWQSIEADYCAIPTDKDNAETLMKDMKHLSVSLDESLTKALLKDVNQSYNTEINDLLLSALAQTISRWSTQSKVVIGLEGHGREDLFSGIDTSNTVGWFTNLYPISLEVEKDMTRSLLIKSVKEQLRNIPTKGMGYGLLRYLHPSEEVRNSLSNTKWDIVFNYLGQFDNVVNEDTVFKAASEDSGSTINDEYAFDAKIDVNGMIARGSLTLTWSYSDQQYDATTIEQLAKTYLEDLTYLIEHCIEKEGTERTASDYGLAPMVETKELDKFLNSIVDGQLLKDQISAIYPLSPVQDGMLFHGLYDQTSNAYTVQHQFDLPDGLDLTVFKSAFEFVMSNHSILRSGFFHDKLSIPVQCVFNKVDLPVETLDYTLLYGEALDREIQLFMQRDQERGFDFAKAPLNRFTFIKVGEGAYKMVWTCHHILVDGWSTAVIMEELLAAYASIIKGETPVAKADDQFEDYIRYINSRNSEEVEAFWMDYMKGFESPSLIPFIGNTLDRNKGQGNLKVLNWDLDEAYTDKIRNYAQEQHLTVNTLVQGVWALLLSKYTGKEEATYGVTVSGRPGELEGAEKRVGMFINTLPLRADTLASQKINEWLIDIQNGHTAAREFQYTAQSDIQSWTGVKGDFFDSIIVFENYPIDEALKSETIINIEMENARDENNYLLTIMVDLSASLNVKFNYYDAFLSEDYVQLIKGHFEAVIDQIVTQGKETIADIDLLTANEIEALAGFNATEVDYPTDKTIVDLFEAQVKATPEAIAVASESETVTFLAFNERVNQLANYLRKQGVKEESLVAICTDRSIDMMVGLMGILKAGGAYVPIDPGYPKDRINYIIENANADFAISHRGYKVLFDEVEEVQNILLDEDWSVIAEESTENPVTELSPENLMYVIYTSGSTGKPKGVMNQHSGVVNRLLWTQNYYQLNNEEDVILQKTTFCFDVSVWELFWPLISGVKLVMAKPEGHKDSDYLREIIDQQGITTMHFVPSMLEVFLLDIEPNTCKGLQRVLCSGEALKPSHVKQFNEKLPHVSLHNLYGPTEAAIDVSEWTVPLGVVEVDKVPIGKPVANTQLYILNEAGAITGIGVPGELYLGGIQVARGYYNRPELTTERFVENPFNGTETSKMYKTGDLARWMPDGNIEYLGRIDNQVKIRGNRIELGEIETVIQLSPYASQSVVLAKEDPNGNKRLVAYVVPEGIFDKETVQNYLRKQLPDYMVPSLMIAIPEMPLTPNGKVDRKALPDPDISELITNKYVAPRNETEEQIAAIWKKLLRVERVGVNDNFFDLGGHSLLATRTVSAIRKELKVEIEIKDVFTQPTVALLTKQIIERAGGVLLPAIEATERPERIPLSFSQERLWFLDKLGGSVQYHLPGVLKFEGELDVTLLSEAFQTVVNRHEILRTVYREENGIAFQTILDENQWTLDFDKENIVNDQDVINSIIESAINKPFDLSNDHMLRAQLVKTGDAEHLMIFVMHHIASDGWSISLFIDELTEIYLAGKEDRSPVLNTLPIQYVDFALWQRNHLEGEILDNKLNYWTEKLTGVEPLNLPTDFTRPPIQSAKGSSILFTVDKSLTNQLNELSRKKEATLYMTLLAAFKVMLQKYSGQDDITVGSPIANRIQEEVESVIGFFVNTLALRSDLSEDPTFVELLASVKETTLDAYANQEVPFERIVDKVAKERDRSRNPIFQVMLALHNNQESVEADLKDVQLNSVDFERETTQFDLSFDIVELENGLNVEIIYCTDLFTAETITRMKDHFQKLLGEIVTKPESKITGLSMLTEEEKVQLLESFNDTFVDYPTDETIVSLFEAQVQERPDATALCYEDGEMTFRELDEKSNQLAHYLRGKGVREEMLVAICVDRSFDMIVGLMGILKAGGVYVPIDPDYPQDRINYIIENANAKFAVSHNGYDRLFADGETVENVLLDKDWETIAQESTAKVANDLTPESLMYVIYTSGSTGKPKGVMNQHSGLVNRLLWTQNEYDLVAGEDAILQKTTFCFDVSVWELFWPLISGVRMVIAKPGGHKESDYLREIIDAQQVTTMHFVPSMLEVFLLDAAVDSCQSLRRVLCSGEALKPSHATQFNEKLGHVELHNLYGPTEAAIDVTYWAVPRETKVDKVPIGKPVANTKLYILNKAGNLTALGVPGELFLAGIQVARGYYNRPDLTEERFIANPFSDEPNAKMYKTGDLARWLPDGNIEYLGRIDSQVKIRGNRIELGEIESVMQLCPSVNQCVVLANADVHGNKRLVAYVVSEGEYDKEGIQAFLKTQVPEYMVPTIMIEMDEIPLTPNGKINRKALPEPEATTLSSKEYVAPRNEVEENIAKIWKALLSVERVGIHDNFFELGGDSIITIQAVSRAKRMGYSLKPRNLFDHQTVADLAGFIAENTATEVVAEQGMLTGDATLLPIQQLFFENEYDDMSHYNFSSLLKIDKKIETEHLNAIVKAIVVQHDALRFTYQKENDQWVQRYGDYEGKVDVLDLRSTPEDAIAETITENCIVAQKSLSLENGEMMRVILMETPDSESHNRFFIVAHHLVVDGVSWRILFEDIQRALTSLQNGEAIELGEKSSSYRQWGEALEKYSQEDKIVGEYDYWTSIVDHYEALPVELEEKEPSVMGDHHGTGSTLNKAMTASLLKEVHQTYNTKIEDLLLSALAMTINQWSKQDKIVVGLEGHGREDLFSELNMTKTVGWFSSLYPILLEVDEENALGNLIKSVKEKMRAIPGKGMGYGMLRYLNPSEEIRQGLSNGTWDMIFNYLGQLDGVVNTDTDSAFEAADEYNGRDTSDDHPFTTKLEFTCSIFGGELTASVRYSRKQYTDENMDAMLKMYVSNLEALITHCLETTDTQATPSDFGLNGKVSFKEMDDFLGTNDSDDDLLLKF